MSALETKSHIVDLIESIDDDIVLTELKNLVNDFVGHWIKDTDYWDELGTQEKSQLIIAIEESKDESNHVTHIDVMKKYAKWLGK